MSKKSEEIELEYKYRLELHAHTSPASPCSEVSPYDVVMNFHNVGYDGIAVTNHFFPGCMREPISKSDYIEMYKLDYYKAVETGEACGMRVYLGAELRFPNENSNDYLLYGFQIDMLSDIYDYLDGNLETFVKDGKDENMFLLQAHPFRDGMIRMNPELLDAIEVFNMHPNHNSRIALAAKFAHDNNKLMTCGSDYHHSAHFGLSATRTAVLPDNTDELVKLLRSGDYIFEISDKIIL